MQIYEGNRIFRFISTHNLLTDDFNLQRIKLNLQSISRFRFQIHLFWIIFFFNKFQISGRQSH